MSRPSTDQSVDNGSRRCPPKAVKTNKDCHLNRTSRNCRVEMGKISSESRLIYDSDPFGTGTFSVVYKGTFNRESVAIKRVQKHNWYTNDSQKVVMRVLDHRNVVKLLFMEDEKDFR